ncbi:MAG: hypothetical protein R3C03_09210 [Pirellulaceae bacterium]
MSFRLTSLESHKENIDLNIGGLIGALVLGGAAGSLLYLGFEEGARTRLLAKVLIGAVIAGAVGGNFLWGMMFPKKQKPNAKR